MKISIRKKIILIFSLFILINGLIGGVSYYKHYILTQKLRILEKKDNIFNTILEARRYEKNYFLYLTPEDLANALQYIRQAEMKMQKLMQAYGKYILARDLHEKLNGIQVYKDSLAALLTYHGSSSSKVDPNRIAKFEQYQYRIRQLGKNITSEMEAMVGKERAYINLLVTESKIYLLAAITAILILSIFVALFLRFNVNRPLKSIEKAIQKIAHGDYTHIPPLSTGDEFESLVISLNDMINELNRRSEQLIQAKKLASLGTLTSGVAHELNNPLNNISTSVQILLEELEDNDLQYKKELLMETEKQIERARDTVKALLEFSRERPFSLSVVNFKDLLIKTIKLIKGELPANVELKIDIPDNIQINIAPRRIQQVLINLFQNSVHAMKNGGTLDIKAWQEEDRNSFVFQVRDTGEGIPKNALPKIFDPFFSTKDVGQGSGLGLSISYGIIEQHGGRIEVESEVGKGAIFTVFLPLK
jgi:two-component system NtrC family sensor kinase